MTAFSSATSESSTERLEHRGRDPAAPPPFKQRQKKTKHKTTNNCKICAQFGSGSNLEKKINVTKGLRDAKFLPWKVNCWSPNLTLTCHTQHCHGWKPLVYTTIYLYFPLISGTYRRALRPLMRPKMRGGGGFFSSCILLRWVFEVVLLSSCPSMPRISWWKKTITNRRRNKSFQAKIFVCRYIYIYISGEQAETILSVWSHFLFFKSSFSVVSLTLLCSTRYFPPTSAPSGISHLTRKVNAGSFWTTKHMSIYGDACTLQ